MSDLEKRFPRVCVDGKWVQCTSAEEIGFLGERLMCDLGSLAGHGKKLLLRKRPETATAPAGAGAGVLPIERLSPGNVVDLRAVAVNSYECAVPTSPGKYRRETWQFVQQDVTGLVPLREAILAAVATGKGDRVWRLFYGACRALKNYGTAVGDHRPVPLQCPSSLAVDTATGRVVPLDAEIQEDLLAQQDEASFHRWFDGSAKARHAPARDASLQHSRALLLFFRYVLGYLGRDKVAAHGIAPQLAAQLTSVPPPSQIDDLINAIKDFAEDWSLVADDGARDTGLVEAPAPVRPVPVARRLPAEKPLVAAPAPLASAAISAASRRSWLGAFLGSMLLNLFLALLILTMGGLGWLYWPQGAVGKQNTKGGNGTLTNTEKTGGEVPIADDTMQYADYCVVFPTSGTSRVKVQQALAQLFPDRVIDPKDGLEEHMQRALASIKEHGTLASLLDRLAQEHSVRFKGPAMGDAPDRALKSIIERGALFAIANKDEKVRHGSLLQVNGLDIIARQAGFDKMANERTLLESLRRAAAEYASARDALLIMGDRPAFLLRVDPTPQGHAEVRKQLLGHQANPVFVPRPVLEMFDAVDPSASTGNLIAKFQLKLDQPCWWRLVGKDDRKNIDYAKNATNNKMKWTSFEAETLITWGPIGVRRQKARTDLISTFDLAVALSDKKIVVFRNQGIMLGDSRKQVVDQTRAYLEDVLHFKINPIEDAVDIRSQGEQFIGTLQYGQLSEQARAMHEGEDLQIMTREQFQRQRQIDDAPLVGLIDPPLVNGIPGLAGLKK